MDTNAIPVPKVQAAAAAGAFTTLLVWLIQVFFDLTIPSFVAAAITVLVSFIAGYVAPRSVGE